MIHYMNTSDLWKNFNSVIDDNFLSEIIDSSTLYENILEPK